MQIVISLGVCGVMASSSALVLGNMVGNVNEGMYVFWGGCCDIDGVSKSYMRDGRDYFLDSLGVWYLEWGSYVSV